MKAKPRYAEVTRCRCGHPRFEHKKRAGCGHLTDPEELILCRCREFVARRKSTSKSLVNKAIPWPAKVGKEHLCPKCERPCWCEFPGIEGEDCECKHRPRKAKAGEGKS